MRADDPNLPNLRHIAEALGELREQVVFVGGAVAGLLVTDLSAEVAAAPTDLRQAVAEQPDREVFVVPAVGIEPTTFRLQGGCSTS